MNLSQIDFVQSISRYLSKCGIKNINVRQINTIISCVDTIVRELEKPTILSTPNMGLQAWLSSDDTGSSSLYLARVTREHFTLEHFTNCENLLRRRIKNE